MNKGKGFLVVCPGCKKSFHGTTDKYTNEAISNGAMFELTKKYGKGGHNWGSFPNNKAMTRADLECPSCGAGYCGRNRRVTVKPDPDFVAADHWDGEVKPDNVVEVSDPQVNTEFVCPDCGKVCKSLAGLKTHKRLKHALVS
jgi:predicted RNA-binding Zn-ribbon protein involved in translation (DUF1610 family)